MHSRKIIKLDPKQQTLFGLLGQQIRPTRTTKSETADDGDLDNENPQSQTELSHHYLPLLHIQLKYQGSNYKTLLHTFKWKV